jgi:PAS domain S-box-containing protein
MAAVNLQRADVCKIGRRLLLASGAVAALVTLGALGLGAWLLQAEWGAAERSGADAAALARMGAQLLALQTVALTSLALVFLTALWRLRGQLSALAESRERNRAIVDNMVDGAIHIDARGRLVALNAAAERMFQRDSGAVRGEPLSMLLAVAHRDEVEACIRGPQGAGCRPINAARELTGLRRDGSEFPLYLALSEVSVGAEPVFTAIARDLTETRRRMEELAEARDQAMAADRAKSQFLAVMSHEIRTPMNGILGMLDLLRDGALTAQQREFIDTAEQSSQVLLGIINDILDLSKIEAGKLELQQIDFDLRATVEEVTALAAGHARDKQLEVVSFIEQDVPTSVVGDPFRLRQVLMNLTNNALKFTDRGEVVVHLTAMEVADTGARIRISVRDTGIGIDEEVQRQLFRPFSQGDASTTRRFGGTGLGLAISKRLVELMGGDIGVESTPGHGATFWFTVTLGRAAEPAEQPAADLHGVRVLIVDDNATNRLILENYLGNWGAESHSVASGLEAMRALQQARDAGRPFALAILDMQMPEMDGLELAQRIKGDATVAGTRLLMLSSLGFPGEDARRAGIGVSLLKPVRQNLLHEAALKVLGVGDRETGEVAAGPPREQFRARVLVAEDNPVNQRVVVLMLQRFGIRAEVAGNGRLATEALAGEHGFDLVFMDMQMPVLSGQDATREIRRQEAHRGRTAVPIVAMTASATAADRKACLAAGMDDFIPKPVQRDALEAALRRWLPQRALPTGAGAAGSTVA